MHKFGLAIAALALFALGCQPPPAGGSKELTERIEKLEKKVEALGAGHGYETAAFMEVRLAPGLDTPMQGFRVVQTGGPLRVARERVARWNGERDRSKRNNFV